MSFAPYSTANLIPAEPGCVVMADAPISNHPGPYPLIAWATVVIDFDFEARAITQVQPVFLVDGKPYTPLGAGVGEDYICREPTS